MAELRQLAINYKFGNFLNKALCDLLVCGIQDEATQCKLLAEADLTLAKAMTLTQSGTERF